MSTYKTLAARIDRMASSVDHAGQDDQPPQAIFRIPLKVDEPQIPYSVRSGPARIDFYPVNIEDGNNEPQNATDTAYQA